MPMINGVGKPAGVRCLHLKSNMDCALFGKPERPAVCASFAAEVAWCGTTPQEAHAKIKAFEAESQPT